MHPPRRARSAPAATPALIVALLAALPGCDDARTPMTVDADRVAAPPAADAAPAPPAAKPKPRRGEIRSPKDDILPDAP
jgi:hypothetical protein